MVIPILAVIIRIYGSSKKKGFYMQLSINVDLSKNNSLQNQIFESIREQILNGQLKPDTLLPSTRLLSDQLNVSRNTIVLAYDRLIAEDYICSRRTIGTFVNPKLPESLLTIAKDKKSRVSNKKIKLDRNPIVFNGRVQALHNPNRSKLDIDFWVGRPDSKSFPDKIWRQIMLNLLRTSSSNMTKYHDPAGIFELRHAIAEHLRPARGIDVEPEQIIVVNGSQEALNIVGRLLVDAKSEVVTECPCYQGAVYVLESYGAKIHPVNVDKDGLDISQLPDKKISLAYVTPSHQYPIGSTLSLNRRIRLLDWASEVGAYIIEDDYDSDFRHHGSPLTAVAGQDSHGSVIYLGTFSKSIGAGLRVGYMVVPKELVKQAKTVKALFNNGHAWLDQAVLAEFISSGAYAKHLRRIRRLYLSRRDSLVDALNKHFGKVKLSGLEGGMHLVWHLPKDLPNAAGMKQIAEETGVGIYTIDTGAAYEFGKTKYSKRTLMLGYSSVSEDKIQEGIKRIASALNSK
jgi:GntR family transcriptional regulator / MocR family aminotransferase